MISPAQQLPILVLEDILEYAIYKYPDTVDRSGLRVPIIANALAVASSCRLWRRVMLGILFKTASVKNTFPILHPSKYNRWLNSRELRPSLPAAVHLGVSDKVRSVVLHCDFFKLLKGISLGGLHRGSIARVVFHAVSTVKVKLGKKFNTFDKRLLDEGLHARLFCNALNRAFPAATALNLEGFDMGRAPPDTLFFRQFYSRLLEGKTRISTDTGIFHEAYDCTQALFRSCQPIREIHITNWVAWPATTEIIRRHANTLEDFTIENGKDGILRNILLDNHGLPVSYPLLHTLNIEDDSSTADFVEHLPPSRALLPALEHVVCRMKCPDLVELLLRTNSSLLRSFVLCAPTQSLELLMRRGVFSRQYPAMKYAKITNCNEVNTSDTIRATLHICRSASTIFSSTQGYARFSEIAEDIASLRPQVRQINFPNLITTVEEAVAFVKAQPVISMVRMYFTLSEVQRETVREHARCVRGCVHDVGSSAHIYPSRVSQEYFKTMLGRHIDIICSEGNYLAELIIKFHPISERLVVLETSICTHRSGTIPPMDTLASLVYMALLCPTIRVVHLKWINETYTLYRSDFIAHASFRTMEERLLELVSDNE